MRAWSFHILTAPLPCPSQASHRESEEALQKRLDEVSRELCRAQSSHASLRADAEKAQEQQQQMAGEGGSSGARGSVQGAGSACRPSPTSSAKTQWVRPVG